MIIWTSIKKRKDINKMITSEIRLKKIAFFIFIFVITFLLLPIGCSKPFSKEKADQIAKTKLEEYCKNEGIEIPFNQMDVHIKKDLPG